VDFLTLTYLDNEALDQNTIAEIESHKHDRNWWPVYGLGKLGVIESRIYKDWKIIPELPHEAKLVKRGLDFGYTNDPTAIIDIYTYNGGIILDEVAYQTRMLNKDIIDVCKSLEKVTMIADSSEPKSIEEISLAGILIMPAIKGPGSINKGIQKVQSERISVTARSVNTIKEYRNYLFVTDKNGNVTNEPTDRNNHAMDAIRYAINALRSVTQEGAAEKQKVRMQLNRNRAELRSTK